MHDTLKIETAVSVIVPVYNSEKFLEACVATILSQSLANFELILVDDGSTDSSGEICDTIASKDERVRVFHKQNSGMCAARNFGISMAQGEYIAFCDNDDKYLDNLLLDNFQLAKQYDADVVRFLRDYVRMNNGKEKYASEIKGIGNHYWNKAEAIAHYDSLRTIGGGVWNGMYKRTFILENGIKFDETMRSGMEDLDFNLRVYAKMRDIYVNSKSYYVWIQRDDHSTSRKFKMNFIDSVFKCAKREFELVADEKINPTYLMELMGNTYIYNIVNALLIPNSSLQRAEKINLIAKFRESYLFSELPGRDYSKQLREKNIKAYVIYTLFIKKHYNLLFETIRLQQKIMQR